MSEPFVMNPKPIKKQSTLDVINMIEHKPVTVLKTAASYGMEADEYVNALDKKDGVGPKNVHIMAKVCKKHNIPTKKVGKNPPVVLGKLLLPPEAAPKERAFGRFMFHNIMRKEIEGVLNYGIALLEPVNIDPITRKMTNLQKIDGAFTVSDQVADSLLRPAVRRENEYAEHPRLVVELADITRGQLDMPFGGEKTLRINNDPSRFPTPRVAETEEFPKVSLGTEEITDNIVKFGVALEASYEFIQAAASIPIDHIAIYFAQLATYWRMHEVNVGIKEMLKIFTRTTPAAKPTTKIGSNDANSASNPQLFSRFKTGTDYHLDLYSWRNMWKSFEHYSKQHIVLNHILARAQYTTEIELLNLDKTNIPLDRNVGPRETVSSVNPFPPLRTRDGKPYGWTDTIPDERYLIYDRNWALQYYVRMLSAIAETERFILNQTQVWTLSKAFGFKVYDEDGIEYIQVKMRPVEVT